MTTVQTAAVFRRRILREALLFNVFGDDYRRCQARVGRYPGRRAPQ